MKRATKSKCHSTGAVKRRSLHGMVVRFIKELEDMKQSSQYRANDLLRPDTMRQYSQATADSYAFVQIRLRMILDKHNTPPAEQCGTVSH